MRRIFLLIVLAIFFSYADAQSELAVQKDCNVKIKIPSAWIEKIRHYNYSSNNKELISEFENFIKPDTLANPHAQHVDEDYGRVFNEVFVDLDGKPGDELAGLIGWDVTCPYLTVFKEEEGNWYLIYLEEIDTFYGAPSLSIANCFSPNKTFYLKRVDDHGSGIYIDHYSFYKLVNDKVYHCLDLVNEAHIYGWGLYMNQAVKMNFQFDGDGDDGVLVDYNYNFFPGAIKRGACSWCVSEDIPLIKGDATVYYKWDDKHFIYKLDVQSSQTEVDDLTADKIACFGDFGNDTLFVRAFRGQINEVLKTGSLQQKTILKSYLALVKKNKTAITQKMEVTGKAGNTTFYK